MCVKNALANGKIQVSTSYLLKFEAFECFTWLTKISFCLDKDYFDLFINTNALNREEFYFINSSLLCSCAKSWMSTAKYIICM